MKADPFIGLIMLGTAAIVCGLAVKSMPFSVAAREVATVRRVAYGADPVSATAVDEAIRKADFVVASCQSDGISAVVDLVTWKADQLDPREDRDAWIGDLKQLEDISRKALACEPTDGILWVRLAFARWFLGGSAEEQAKLLAYSQAYAPSEFAAIRARLFQWRRVSPAVLAISQNAVAADLRATLLDVPPSDAIDLLQDLSPQLTGMMQQEMQFVPMDRFEALQRANGSEALFSPS